MGSPKSVLLWGSEDIFGQAIELMLAEMSSWQVECIPCRNDVSALLLAVKSARPDIIIIPLYGLNDMSGCPFEWLFEQYPAIKIITISLDDNSMNVYSKHNYVIRQVSDLISIFENNS